MLKLATVVQTIHNYKLSGTKYSYSIMSENIIIFLLCTMIYLSLLCKLNNII